MMPSRPSLDSLLDHPKAVTTLDLSFGNLTELSGKIMFFTNLRRLDLKGNKLRTLPAEIGDLTKLTDLDLRLNRLTQLPPEISNLTGLKYLLLTGNALSAEALNTLRSQLPFTKIICSPAGLIRSQNDRPAPLTIAGMRAIDSLSGPCGQGSPGACRALGSLYEELHDFERAILAYEGGCRLNSNDTSKSALTCCMEAAEFYAEFLNDRETSMNLYKHVCQLGSYFTEEACEHMMKKRRKH
jgi:hypothetical protein